MRTHEPWYESDNPDRVARSIGIRISVWTVIAVIFFGLVGVGIWGFQVLTAPVKGRGDAVQQREAANNRIAQQERFEQIYADVRAADQRLAPLARAAAADPADKTAQQTYTGAVTYCIGLRQDYNALARKYTAEQFRATDLPATIDDTDPTTDCKEAS